MIRTPLRERARNRWRSLLPPLGVDSRFLTGKHGPCPICVGTDRFRWDNKDGDGTFFCTHCGAGDGIRLAETVNRWTFREAVDAIEALLGDAPADLAKPVQGEAEQRAAMKRVWDGCAPLTGNTVAGRYLLARTGCSGSSTAMRASALLRHGPSQSDHPALLGIVRGVDGAPVNVHRTWLARDASSKADVTPPRMVMSGELPPGCAIRLMAPQDGRLGIAEGIETALAASTLFGVPVWGAVNALQLERWEAPEGVTEVLIFGDHDQTYRGHSAAYTLAHRLECRGLKATVRIPPTAGDDWADVYARDVAKPALEAA